VTTLPPITAAPSHLSSQRVTVNTAAMSAPPPPKLSKRRRFLNRVKGVFQPNSRPPPPSTSKPDHAAGDSSPSPRPSPSPNPSTIVPAPAQIREPTGQSEAPSTSNAGPALSMATTASLATPAAPTATANKPSEAWSLAWTGLETTLRLLEKSADAFPPLKSAVGGFVACLDVIQASLDSRFTTEDYV